MDPILVRCFFLWFVPLIWKRGDDIKLIAVARSIGIKNTNTFGKLFSFYGVSDDSIDIKLVEIDFEIVKQGSTFVMANSKLS